MSAHFFCRRLLSHCLLLTCLTFLAFSITTQSVAQTALQAKLVPSVIISGQLGSLQQVQYSTNLADPNAWSVLSYVRMDTTPKSFYDETAGEKRFYRTKTVGVADTNLLWIPPGTFLMGSPTNEEGRTVNEGPQTLVTLTHGFLMGRFEVKNAEWINVFGSFPAGGVTNLFAAAVPVSWSDATNYCALRTAAEISAGRIPAGWFYRLPTEAEWEYACRAGTTTPFAIGSGTELRNDAVRADAQIMGSVPYPSSITPVNPITYNNSLSVGRYAPNAFGLYDMHGNVAEWCLDNASGNSAGTGNLPGGAVTNLVGTLDPRRIFRGGADQSAQCRSAFRASNLTGSGGTDKGLRVVLIPLEEP